VQNVVDVMKTKTTPKSVADHHAILHGIYKWAGSKTRRLVDVDPCTETDLPKRIKTPPKGLRLPELHALLSVDAIDDMEAEDLRDAADVVAPPGVFREGRSAVERYVLARRVDFRGAAAPATSVSQPRAPRWSSPRMLPIGNTSAATRR
jgi:hypothetical protein